MIRFLIICFLIIPAGVIAQENIDNQSKVSITIREQILPGNNWDYIYKISNRKIKIKRTKDIYILGLWLTESDFLYRKRLNKTDSDSLLLILKKNDVLNLKESYTSGVLDGVNWTFDITIDDLQNKIRLDNYFLPQLGELLDFIDRQLPEKRRYISFDFFNIRDEFENK